MDPVREVQRADQELRDAQQVVDHRSHRRAILAATAVDTGPRGTLSRIAEALDIKLPTAHNLVKRGRELLAEKERSMA